jgi:hypothetical protein
MLGGQRGDMESPHGSMWNHVTTSVATSTGLKHTNKEGNKSAREGHWPFLLEFVKKFEIMGFKDLGPVE